MNLEETQPLDSASSEVNIFELFARHAAANPSAVAVIDAAGAVTYGTLAEQADTVSAHLLKLGLVPEQPVAVLMLRRARLLAVLLGIWKAGGAYVPFDPNDPPARVRGMLRSSGCRLVLSERRLLEALQSADAAPSPDEPVLQYVDLDSIAWPARADDATMAATTAATLAATPCAPGGSRLAYLLFTSGSTGEPKAVEVEHRHTLALLRSARSLLNFNAQDRYLASSTIAFDASITELFLPLVTGASLLLRDRGILLDPKRMAHDVRAHGVTVVQTGPSVWAVILKEAPDFPRVRVLITHGEAVSPELARRLCAYGIEAWNLYGPTETTVWATGWRMSAEGDPALSSMSAPIGRPLPHIRAFVVDEQGNPAGDGVEGELLLGGPSVARGYRGNDALTHARFVNIGGERVYRSGDIVVRDERGVLHYFGRNDDQMKVRGIRVEPGEVEAAILQDPAVMQAAATWYTTRSNTRSIVAAVVANPGAGRSAQYLHEGLATRLPRSMIPTRFLFMPGLPMTTSGKVDRKAIRAAAQAATKPEAAKPPGLPGARRLSPTELAIANIWKRVLGLESVTPHDHFFSIGGDSLSAIHMMVQVEARFGLVLPVRQIFETPSLEAFAAAIYQTSHQAEDKLRRGFVFPLVPDGNGPPLFFCEADLSLARRHRWTVPVPLYAIANWAAGSGFVQAASLPALAAAHLQGIRRVQPQGPYRLGGYSLGGLVAWEIAQQLRDAGEFVELLFLLDPMAPARIETAGLHSHPVHPPALPVALRKRIKRRWRRIAEGPGAQGWSRWMSWMLPDGVREVTGWVRYMLVHQYLRHPNAALRMMFPRNRWKAFWFAARRMVKSYTARPYDGPVLAVFCQQGKRGSVWSTLLEADADVEILDAPHLALFEEPNLNRWMDLLTEYVGNAQQDLPRGGEVHQTSSNISRAGA